MISTANDPICAGYITAFPAQKYYPEGSYVALTAEPQPGYAFDHWEGDIENANSKANPLFLQMNNDREVVAVFKNSLYFEVRVLMPPKIPFKVEFSSTPPFLMPLTGHAFWQIIAPSCILNNLQPIEILRLDSCLNVPQGYGFDDGYLKMESPAFISNDRRWPDISHRFLIKKPEDVIRSAMYVADLRDEIENRDTPKYNLESRNCADEVILVGEKAGVKVPDKTDDVVVNVPFPFDGLVVWYYSGKEIPYWIKIEHPGEPNQNVCIGVENMSSPGRIGEGIANLPDE